MVASRVLVVMVDRRRTPMQLFEDGRRVAWREIVDHPWTPRDGSAGWSRGDDRRRPVNAARRHAVHTARVIDRFLRLRPATQIILAGTGDDVAELEGLLGGSARAHIALRRECWPVMRRAEIERLVESLGVPVSA